MRAELYYPLKIKVCQSCWLVQTEDYTSAEELFRADYAYFSSTSNAWLRHAKKYCDDIIGKLSLNNKSFVVELACNDGYLLRNFIVNQIPCLGIEPTKDTALEAEKLGIEVLREFFTEELGKQLSNRGQKADLIIGNNVLAHVPDVNDFVLGMKQLLKRDGVITLEFPHLLQLIRSVQFDTVYHEHFSYFSLHVVSSIFKKAGLRVFDVEKILTHGGSLRVYGCHIEDARENSSTLKNFLDEEVRCNILSINGYKNFQSKADEVKNTLLQFLIEQKQRNKVVIGYGAAAKGNTILNYAGIKSDLLPFVCDAAPSKQGKFMPGSHIPIRSPAVLAQHQPDYVLILPWNLADEIKSQLHDLSRNGTQFVVAVPELKVL